MARTGGLDFGRLGLIVGLLALSGCQEVEWTVPKVLHGTWTSPSFMYEERSMVISADQISFGDGTGEWANHRIVGLHSETAEAKVSYTLDYAASNGAEYRLRLVYDLRDGGLRLGARRHVVWTREGA